jgi:hypothetical protein
MDTEQTTEQQLLAEAKKQTAALESIRGIGLVWTAVAGIAVVIWLLIALLG